MPRPSARNPAGTQRNATLVMMLALQILSGNIAFEKKSKLRHCFDSLSYSSEMENNHAHFADSRGRFVAAGSITRLDILSPRRSDMADPPYLMHKHLQNDALEHLTDEGLLAFLLAFGAVSPDQTGSARQLLQTFGDLGAIVSSRTAVLRDKGGLTETQIFCLKLFALSAQRLARAKLQKAPIMSGSRALLDYCHAALGHCRSEQFRVLFLDRKNRLIADEVLGHGTIDHVPVYPRDIIRRCLELDASALILVHNHPSGDPTPSEADISMTQVIQLAADALSITLHDHVIIGKSSEVSLRAEGLIKV